ncbi:hypothetical protein AM587_10013238 [Phytophthora nicotianae]|uniref:SCP domain-containing protein n=1 Tax=Phytophthora nicotianae TaxID=4792 RepID=A0A0W8CFA2_PHYNI|nr:hypothetical protein AM587_10013238 [Phytophthora nicotianae]
MNIKGLFAFALVALVGMTNAETAVHEDHVARELQVADFSKKLLDAVNAKRAEKGLKAVCINAKLAKAAQVLASASTTGCSTSLTRMARPHETPIIKACPWLLDFNVGFGLFAFALVTLAGIANADAENHVARELQVADFSTKLLNSVNAKRAEKGLKPVCINTKLAKAAQILADDNAKNNKASADAVVATWVKSSSAYLFSDFKFIGPGYAYDKTKLYKHYWVMDMANADGEVCA